MSPRSWFGGILLGVVVLTSQAATAQDDGTIYVTASDTGRFSPPAALSPFNAPGRWYQRKVGFAARGDTIFNVPPGGIYPDLTVTPNLTGRYNLYVNLREVDYQTGLQLKLSKHELAYTITPALGTARVHTNRDILCATDVDMTGQTILMRYIGRLLYFSYLKFVPVAADRPELKVAPERVREEPLTDPAGEWAKTQDLVPATMHELKHEPDVPATPAPDGGKGYVIYSRSYLDLIFPDTVPATRDVTAELRLSAARGEYEPMTFSVHAARDLGPCRVSVDDLASGSQTIARDAVSVAAVACRNLRTSFNGNVFMRAPAMLDATMPVTIPAGQSKQFWLTVKVPANAAPGDYIAGVTFTPTGLAPTRLKLTLHVYPFALPEPKDVALGMYDQMWAARAGDNWLRDRWADQRAHGMTTVGYCGALDGEMVLADGKASVRFDRPCGFAQLMDAYRDAGFSQPVLWLMSGDIWDWCSRQAKPGSDEFAAIYRQIIQSILARSQTRRWPGIIFQPIDEPGSYGARPNAGYIEQWAVQSKLIKEAGGVVEVDHIPFSTDDVRIKGALERALPVTDIFTQRFSTRPIWFDQDGWGWDRMRAQAAAWGKQLWSYNINDANFFPELPTQRLAYGYFIWLQNVRGQLTWSYLQAAANPFNALDGTSTDMMYTYPAVPEAGMPGGPSPMWECIREGVDDLRYVQLLEQLIAQAEKSGQGREAQAARAVLDQIKTSFDWARLREKNRYIECQWDEIVTAPTGQRTVKGHFNIPNGWDFADYDRWRQAVAEQIVRLGGGQ